MRAPPSRGGGARAAEAATGEAADELAADIVRRANDKGACWGGPRKEAAVAAVVGRMAREAAARIAAAGGETPPKVRALLAADAPRFDFPPEDFPPLLVDFELLSDEVRRRVGGQLGGSRAGVSAGGEGGGDEERAVDDFLVGMVAHRFGGRWGCSNPGS